MNGPLTFEAVITLDPERFSYLTTQRRTEEDLRGRTTQSTIQRIVPYTSASQIIHHSMTAKRLTEQYWLITTFTLFSPVPTSFDHALSMAIEYAAQF
jgi:hypothetical protein